MVALREKVDVSLKRLEKCMVFDFFLAVASDYAQQRSNWPRSM